MIVCVSHGRGSMPMQLPVATRKMTGDVLLSAIKLHTHLWGESYCTESIRVKFSRGRADFVSTCIFTQYTSQEYNRGMTERLAGDVASTGRAPSIQSLANTMKEAMSSTVKEAVNTAHSKAVAHEAKSAANSAVKGMQSTLLSLREGSKHSAGLKKVPTILSAHSYLEESSSAIDVAVQTAERAVVRETNTFLDYEKTIGVACNTLTDDLMILNTVWHKLMSPGGSRSRQASLMMHDD